MRIEKGVSIIALIVTIVVIVIIASIGIYYGLYQNLDEATFARVYAEMSEVSTAVRQRKMTHEIDPNMYPYVGEELSESNSKIVDGIEYGTGYYYISQSSEKKLLNLERVQDSYIVSYESGEVITIQGISKDGQDYYKLTDIKNKMGDNKPDYRAEYDEAKGVNKPILEDGMVPVKKDGSSWVITTPDDNSWYDYSSDSKRYANIMLKDEMETQNFTNAEVRNKTLEELKDEIIKVEGSSFVWIPRYTYKEEADGTISIVYSNIINDYTQDGYKKHPAFYFGEYSGGTDLNENSGYTPGGQELTGIWISKYEAGYSE